MVVLVLGIGTAHGSPFVIDDAQDSPVAYWGGKYTAGYSNQDVVGAGWYDFSKMEVSFTGNLMTVKVFGDFTRAENQGGDLFLSSTGWRAFGIGANNSGDTFTKDEGWDYVVSSYPLKGHIYAGVFKLQWNPDGTFGNFFSTTGSRIEQGYTLIPETLGEKIVDDVTIINADDSLSFEFDYTKLGTLGPTSFGVHFTQGCGNDVVEGGTATSAPEPSTVFLLLTGFVGLAFKLRRKLF